MNKQGFHCIIASIIFMLAGCSTGGGETGTGQDTVTVGVITGFGSVFVNGVEYETDMSTITLDDNSSTETDLKVGMVVTLSGDVNADGTTGNALSINFDDNVEGMVLVNTVATNNQLVVLGQTIIVDSFDTVFESAIPAIKTFEQIEINNIVEVSGYTAGDGVIYATRIEVKQQTRNVGDEIELEGLVSNVTATTFEIGSMTILYSTSILSDFKGADLANGDFVEVKSISDLDVNNHLIASNVELKELNKAVQEVNVDKEVELEGIISAVENSTQFSLNGQVVVHNSETDINDVNQIVVGKKAKVEGTINQNDQIVAKEIEVKSENKTKIDGLITAINTEIKTITVFGDEIFITNSTTVKDERDGIEDNARHFFNFTNLNVGDNVEVSYFLDTNTDKLIATKLELEDIEENDDNSNDDDHDNEWEIKNIITAYDSDENTIEILSRTIDVSNIENFIGVAAVGKLAEVQGVITNDIWVATELEIEDEDDPSEKQEKADDDF